MKTLIIAINSKYIHASLAPWYLKACCGHECGEVVIGEYTINDSMDMVLGEIFAAKPDVAAFSCYIWNIGYVLKLAEDLKKVMPKVTILLGGPEVSYDSGAILQQRPYVDFVLSGEGEVSFQKLLAVLLRESDDYKSIEGLTYREYDEIISNGSCLIVEDLSTIPEVYTEEMLSSLGNRIVYFESSRGCPFSCSYCLSSTTAGVRFFPLERVEKELKRLVEADVRQIKFVDRTFNSHPKRAKAIFRHIIERYGTTEVNFHFEVAADLFDDEMFEILALAPVGRIQFEIGVQTTNTDTLERIHRKTSLKTLFENVESLKSLGNIHLHMDLIAGLPGEDYSSFIRSFNEVYTLGPHQLQLGFLKMLKGSQVREEAEKYGYRFRSYAPYEVLENKAMGYEQLRELKGIEELVDRYYNSGRFVHTLRYIENTLYETPFEFYKEFHSYVREREYFKRGISGRELYTILTEYLRQKAPESRWVQYNELLKLDYLSMDNTNNLPSGIDRQVTPGFKEECFSFLRKEENILRYLPQYAGIPVKQMIKHLHFEKLLYRPVQKLGKPDYVKEEVVLLFDYAQRDRVTGRYKSMVIELG